MEIIGAIILIWVTWVIITAIIKSHRQKIRDKIAHEVLDNNFNFTKVKVDVLATNKNFGFIKTDRICPFCNGILVTRQGIYGSFLGCSNYPKCNFTKKID